MGTFIIIGLVAGVIYGLAALGLVLIYKGSRVFNFAQAEFGTMAMYVIYMTTKPGFKIFGINVNMPYAFAALAAIIVAVLFGLAVERFVARPLSDAPKVIVLVGTAGAALLAIGLELAIGKAQPRSIPPAITGKGVQLLGFIVSPQNILALAMLAIVAVATAMFFRYTYLGMAILANSMDSTAARIVGANANRISALTWGIAGLMGGLAGILLGPRLNLVPGIMTTTILIPAFTAGIVGGMTSLLGAFVAGEIIGVIQGVGQYFILKYPVLNVIPQGTTLLLFLVLMIMLLVRPRGLFGSEA